VVTRALPDRRLVVMNREFTVRRLDGSSEKQAIETPDALLALLASHFDLSFPPGTRFGRGEVPWPV
jgi:arylamine N-acetyltransferase